jgi:glycosyltransferase involved in cell wall biosynthesis
LPTELHGEAAGIDVAIVHDHIVQRGGGDRIMLHIAGAFPGAPIYTSFYRPEDSFPEFAALDVRPSAVNRIGVLRTHHRAAMPIFPIIMGSRKIPGEVVICTSSGWAQGARVSGRKVVFVCAMAQWLYMTDTYVHEGSGLQQMGARALRPALVRWDRWHGRRADRIVVMSRASRDLVREHYGRDADIVPPMLGLDPNAPEQPIPGVEPGYFLCSGRVIPSKNVDKMVAAFADLPDERLVVVGEGPLLEPLQAAATPNVRFVGNRLDSELQWLYRNCQAVLAAGIESYGLTPVEAAAYGRPSIALAAGGLRETVEDGVTGVTFERPDPASIRAAVERFSPADFQPDALAALAARHAPEVFAGALQRIVREEAAR